MELVINWIIKATSLLQYRHKFLLVKNKSQEWLLGVENLQGQDTARA